MLQLSRRRRSTPTPPRCGHSRRMVRRRQSPTPWPVRDRSADMIASIALLWHRMMASYATLSESESQPFMVCAPSMDAAHWIEASRRTPWLCTLGTVERFIACTFRHHETRDECAWVIALCLLDRLQLKYDVQQRTAGGAVVNDAPPLRMATDNAVEMLIALYAISIKLHLDGIWPLRHITGLLPGLKTASIQVKLVEQLGAMEIKVLTGLHFHCNVTREDACRLVEQFLSREEGEHLQHALTT